MSNEAMSAQEARDAKPRAQDDGLPVIARLYMSGRYRRASVMPGPGESLVRLSDALNVIQHATRQHEDLVAALDYATKEIDAIYQSAARGELNLDVSIGQFGRLRVARALLARTDTRETT